MAHEYLKEMIMSGYDAGNLDDFHLIVLPYLGEKFFPSKETAILDIGAGAGHCLIPLQGAGYKKLSAADNDEFNEKFFIEKKIHFSNFDAEKGIFPYPDGSFDVVLAFHVIEHLLTPTHFLKESKRVLKEGGRLIIVTPDWRKQYKIFYRDPTHMHPYDRESMMRLLRSYDFKIVFQKSFGVLRGLGRLKIYKIIKPLMFTGLDLITIGEKK